MQNLQCRSVTSESCIVQFTLWLSWRAWLACLARLGTCLECTCQLPAAQPPLLSFSPHTHCSSIRRRPVGSAEPAPSHLLLVAFRRETKKGSHAREVSCSRFFFSCLFLSQPRRHRQSAVELSSGSVQYYYNSVCSSQGSSFPF